MNYRDEWKKKTAENPWWMYEWVWDHYFRLGGGMKALLTRRVVGFNVMEWGWILWMGRLAFWSASFVTGYGPHIPGSMEYFISLYVAPLINTALTGVLPVFLLRGAVGAFRKLRS